MALLLAGSFGLAATFLIRSDAFGIASGRSALPDAVPEIQPLILPAVDETAGMAAGSLVAAVDPATPPPSDVDSGEAVDPGAPVAPATDELIRFCSSHVTSTRSFVVFRYGTCVVDDEPTTDPVADARARLEACNDPEARFVPELATDGNLIVSFKEPVFHNFSEADRADIRAELDRLTPALMTPKERVAAGDGWMPPVHARFGLLARRRLLEDAAQPVPVRIIRAKQRVTASLD